MHTRRGNAFVNILAITESAFISHQLFARINYHKVVSSPSDHLVGSSIGLEACHAIRDWIVRRDH